MAVVVGVVFSGDLLDAISDGLGSSPVAVVASSNLQKKNNPNESKLVTL